jgi:hypothetical protein
MEKLTNKEWLNYVRSTIDEKPKRLASQQMQDRDFVDTFFHEVNGEITPLSNSELHGLVLDEPHTSNLFMTVFYDRVVRESIRDGLTVVNKLDIFRREDLPAGKTWSRLMSDIMSDEWYDLDASPVTRNTANSHDIVKEAFSNTPIRRLVQFTIYEDGISEAFRKEMGIQEMLDLFFKRVSDTMNYRVYSEMKDLLRLANADHPSAGEEVAPFVDIVIQKTADGYDIPTDTPIDDAKLSEYDLDAITSAQGLKFFIHSLAYDMSEPSRKYNVGDTDGQFMASLPVGEGVLIIDPNALAGMSIVQDANFHNDTEISKLFKSIIPISNLGHIRLLTYDGLSADGQPVIDSDTDDEDYTVLALILDRNAIEYRFMLEKSLQWENPRALYVNYFTHFWFGILANPFLSAVRILIEDDSE